MAPTPDNRRHRPARALRLALGAPYGPKAMKTAMTEHLAQTLLHRRYADLPAVQQQVIDAVARETPTGPSPELEPPGYWQRLADGVAQIGGSWTFIFAFLAVLVVWVAINSPLMRALGVVFDPYPFIFLNLILSMLAAIQAPIIMMSQNRAAQKDRAEAEHDYAVNLRAELEILRLHDRLDAIEDTLLREMLERQDEILRRLDLHTNVEA
jgi:uncharacterized membrane protein